MNKCDHFCYFCYFSFIFEKIDYIFLKLRTKQFLRWKVVLNIKAFL